MSLAAAFVIPGDIDLPTGGYRYDREVLARLADHGVAAQHVAISGSFPDPRPSDLEAARSTIRAADAAQVLLIDGLAYGVFPQGFALSLGRPIVALVHHPLGLETGLSEARRIGLVDAERGALAVASAVIATSPMTAAVLQADFGVAAERLVVAEPGTARAERARGSGGAPVLLAVGAVSPRKGYDTLIAALAECADMPFRLVIAGDCQRDAATAADLRAQIVAAGLGDRVQLAGALDDAALAEAYQRADVFVAASRFEGYGMALAEAMVRGLPIVTTTGGAAAQTVPDGAGIKVAPDDALALRTALQNVLRDADLRRRLADASFAAGQNLPDWDATTRVIADVLKREGRGA